MKSAQPEGVRSTDRVADAVAALKDGTPVLVADAVDGKHEYDVVLPAALAGPRWTAWTVRHTSGFLCAPLTTHRAGELGLPPMVERNEDPRRKAYTVAVDAADGISTGISAADRARTARVLADPQARPADLRRPGHVVPLRARPGGVVERAGCTEAGVDLCRLAGLPPVALSAGLVADSDKATSMAGPDDVARLAARHDVPVVDIAELVEYRLLFGDGERGRVTPASIARLSTEHGALDVVGYRDEVTGAEHLAFAGRRDARAPLVAVHAECVLGDLFGPSACDCGHPLAGALDAVARAGGVLVYLRRTGHTCTEVPGAHTWTVSDDGAAGAILADLGCRAVRLAPGPTTAARLARPGLAVFDVPRISTASERLRTTGRAGARNPLHVLTEGKGLGAVDLR